MNLQELSEAHALPDAVVSFCSSNGLIDLLALEVHYSYHGTFKGLPGCSDEIEDRLLNLLTITRNRRGSIAPRRRESSSMGSARIQPTGHAKPDHDSPSADPDLQELAILFGLSVRAYNICENAGLHTLSRIRAFALEHGDFTKLRNCGAKTQMELKDLLNRAAGSGYTSDRADSKDGVIDPGRLESICTAQYLKLSTHARNILQQHIGKPSADAIIRFFMTQGRKMPKLPGAGNKVMRELRTMRERTMSALTDRSVEWPDNSDTRSMLLKWAVCHQINPDLLHHLQQADGRLTLFHFLERYLSAEWNGGQLKVYRTQLTGQGYLLTLEAIANEVGLTRERVRQLLVKMDRTVIAHLTMLSDLPGVREHYPELVSTDPGFIVNDGSVSRINEREGTTCSPLLFAYAALVLNSPRLQRVKWTDLFDRSASTKELDRTHPLLVDHDLKEALLSITSQALEVIETKRSIPQRRSLYDFRTTDDVPTAHTILPFLSKLLCLRYPEITVEDFDICLPANVNRSQEELLEEVLDYLDGPSHAIRIEEVWNHRYPDRPITVSGIRSVAIRNKSLFFSIGRESTYGLRRWERERIDLKGGTIRDIIEELLEASPLPLHFEELVEEVKKYRPTTNLSSVRQNLQLEATGRFIFFPGGFLGLSSKEYQSIPDPPAFVPGSLMRAAVLERFKGQHRIKLVEYLKTHCNASDHRIVRVIDNAIAQGRLLIDEHGVIHGTGQAGFDAAQYLDELPFEW